MVGFVGIVRPFQTTSVTPPATPTVATSGTQTTTSKIVIGDGSPKTFTGSFDLTITYYKVKKPKEKPKS